jgi:lipopolysaccharide/colanic/teichoic acid biosynthesis glycosyltransferase/putative NADH-flavin reductase
MRIVITGASGSIGQRLVPFLIGNGHTLLLVGRDPGLLNRMFPEAAATDYKNFPSRNDNFNSCVHLAVKNNDKNSSSDHGESFKKANIDLLKEVYSLSKQAGISQFVNLASFQSDNVVDDDPLIPSTYASSKRQAEQWLNKQSKLRLVNIKIPAVYSDKMSGKLRFVSYLPEFMQATVLVCLGSLKPIVDVELVLAAINDAVNKGESDTILLRDDVGNNIVYRMFKRAIDLIFSILVLLFLWWLLIMVSAIIKLDSKGPVLFVQKRLGFQKRKFNCYKFRTMTVGTAQTGTHNIDRSSITRVGSFLRRTKIDELPQIINLLRGEISLVGPRPSLPSQHELIEMREQLGVLDVLPGITGLSQIRNLDMSKPDQLSRSDAEYVSKRGILLDASIILKTLIGAGQGDKTK